MESVNFSEMSFEYTSLLEMKLKRSAVLLLDRHYAQIIDTHTHMHTRRCAQRSKTTCGYKQEGLRQKVSDCRNVTIALHAVMGDGFKKATRYTRQTNKHTVATPQERRRAEQRANRLVDAKESRTNHAHAATRVLLRASLHAPIAPAQVAQPPHSPASHASSTSTPPLLQVRTKI